MIEVCPECGSGKIEVEGVLLGPKANAICQSCGWRGVKGDLITPMRQKVESEVPTIMTPDQALFVATEVAKDYMNKLAQYASQPVGLAMVESGLVGVKDKNRLARLIRAAMMAAHRATLDEIERIQKELQAGERDAGN